MAELQTIAAAVDLAALTVKICKFLKKVKDAEIIASVIHDKVQRLGEVLGGVQDVLNQRAGQSAASNDPNEIKATRRITESIEACGSTLKQIDEKVVGSTTQPPELGLGRRFKVAFHSHSIGRLQSEVEAHINILSLNLNVLQV